MQVFVNDKYDVSIRRIEVSATYAGVMEGDRDTASKYIREEMSNEANHQLEAAKRLIWIHDPEPERPLPEYTCKANLSSYSTPDNIGDYTVAEIWWFVPDVDSTPKQLVEQFFKDNVWHDVCQSREF